MKMKRKKFWWQKFVIMLLSMAIGAVCGFLMVGYIDDYIDGMSEIIISEIVLTLAILFIGMYVILFLQIILHEAGHLIGGLLSGYTFTSFRIGSFIWLKKADGIRLCRLSIAGTGGQCLMGPPENALLSEGNYPVILYNMGGSLMNLFTGILALIGSLMLNGSHSIPGLFMLMTAVIGLLYAFVNGVPLQTNLINNDGYNAVSLSGNPVSKRAFAIQLHLNSLLAGGMRLRNMPEQYFSVPDDGQMTDSMVCAVGVLCCNRLLDEHRFEEARQLISHMLEIDSQIVGLNRSMLICDLLYCKIIDSNGDNGEIKVDSERLLTKQQRKFMKAMKKFPSVLRTEYAYTYLVKRDRIEAEAIKARFEKIAKNYPYPSDIQSERELMNLVSEKEI